MKLVYSFLRFSQISLFITAVMIQAAIAQIPGNDNDKDTVPFFGTNDNDTWNMTVPSGGEITAVAFSELLVFSNDDGSTDTNVRIRLTFKDGYGNVLNVSGTSPNTNSTELLYDLGNLPLGAEYNSNGKNYSLVFDPNTTIEAPTGYLADSILRKIYIHYEVYTRSGKDPYTLILGQTPDAFLVCNLEIDNSNKVRRHANTALTQLPKITSFKVFPNPFTDKINIETTLPDGATPKFQLLDLRGRAYPVSLTHLSNYDGQLTAEIATGSYAPGIYILRISVAGAQDQIMRIVKSN